jgi:DNA-binding HxlR family transcriptional regulator
MSLLKQYMENYDCALEVVLDVIGGKWKGIILYHLLVNTMRYNDLKRMMPKITPRILTNQLRELERDGLIRREVYPEVPPRVEYQVTELGESLRPIILALSDWGEANNTTLLQNRHSIKE